MVITLRDREALWNGETTRRVAEQMQTMNSLLCVNTHSASYKEQYKYVETQAIVNIKLENTAICLERWCCRPFMQQQRTVLSRVGLLRGLPEIEVNTYLTVQSTYYLLP